MASTRWGLTDQTSRFFQSPADEAGYQQLKLRENNIFSLKLCVPVCLCIESYQFGVPESALVSSVVAKIKALDLDVGSNAEMDYRILDGDGLGTFRIITDPVTQEGLFTLQKVLISLYQVCNAAEDTGYTGGGTGFLDLSAGSSYEGFSPFLANFFKDSSDFTANGAYFFARNTVLLVASAGFPTEATALFAESTGFLREGTGFFV